MRRNFAYLALAAAIATLSACGDGDDGHDGANGLAALINLAAEPAGAHCAEGGTRVDAGPDTNANGVLDADEVTQTTYVCTGVTGAAGATGLVGATGATGTTGQTGDDGLNTLMLLSSETAGANCVFGGTRIDAGLDTNRNNLLEPGEITSTGYVCNTSPTPIVLPDSSVTTQGEANASYVAADPSAPIQLTLPDSAALGLGDTLAITGAGQGGWILQQNPGQSILVAGLPVVPSEFSWSDLPNQPLGGTRYGLASSSDGSYLYALSYDGTLTQATLSTSNDGGISWTDFLLVDTGVGAIASSADGARSVYVLDNGDIAVSEDFGANWTTPGAPPSLAAAVAVAMSADGLKVFIADGGPNGDIYLSSDGGDTWVPAGKGLLSGWAALGMSADGGRIFALPNDTASMEISRDGGLNWSTSGAPTTLSDWSAIAVSGNGRYIIAGDIAGDIRISRDFGSTWESQTLPAGISSLAISRDGRAILAGTFTGALYQSGDYGMTWAEVDTSTPWTAPSNVRVALSADGSGFFAFADDEPMLSTRIMSRTSLSNGFLAGSVGDSVTLQYIGNDEFIVLRYTNNSGNFIIN